MGFGTGNSPWPEAARLIARDVWRRNQAGAEELTRPRLTGRNLTRAATYTCKPRAQPVQAAAWTPASLSHSRIFCLGMAPTFIEAIWPPRNSIMVGMPRTP